jgi:hypothetical protein
MDVSTSLRRQKSGHPQPPVNICGCLDGHKVEVYGEAIHVGLTNTEADELRKVYGLAALKAIALLNRTLSRRPG